MKYLTVLHTLLDGIGPAIAPTIARLLDRYPTNKDFLGVLAVLPTDEAFGLLVDRLDTKQCPGAVRDAAKRYPVRALRRLAVAAGSASAVAAQAQVLLREHVADYPELVSRLSGDLRAVVDSVTA